MAWGLCQYLAHIIFQLNYFLLKGDVNGDGRADVVCTADGSMMVWQSKDVGHNSDIYDPNNKWIDETFGFCKLQNKMVEFSIIYLYLYF